MKEYQSCKTNSEVLFNNMLREACNPIECAFGHLKARWSILTRKMDLKLENIPIVVMACFVLHNFCEWHNDTGFLQILWVFANSQINNALNQVIYLGHSITCFLAVTKFLIT